MTPMEASLLISLAIGRTWLLTFLSGLVPTTVLAIDHEYATASENPAAALGIGFAYTALTYAVLAALYFTGALEQFAYNDMLLAAGMVGWVAGSGLFLFGLHKFAPGIFHLRKNHASVCAVGGVLLFIAMFLSLLAAVLAVTILDVLL